MIENYSQQAKKIIEIGDLIIAITDNKKKLTSYSNISLGGTPSRKHPEYWNGNIKWINSGAMTGMPAILSPSEYITELGVNHSATKCANKSDTVLSIIEPSINKVSVVLDDAVYFNQSVICLSAKDKKYAGLIYFATRFLINEIKGFATGAAQQSLNKEMFEISDICVPDINNINKLDSLLNQIIKTESSIRVLKEIKQTLLSKYF